MSQQRDLAAFGTLAQTRTVVQTHHFSFLVQLRAFTFPGLRQEADINHVAFDNVANRRQ